MDERKYILVLWPYSQLFMEHSRFDECYLMQPIRNQKFYDSAYFVPEDLFTVVQAELDKPDGLYKNFVYL